MSSSRPLSSTDTSTGGLRVVSGSHEDEAGAPRASSRPQPPGRSGIPNGTGAVAALLAILAGAAFLAQWSESRVFDPPNFVRTHSAIPEKGLANVVIEIPAGTNAKWEVSKDGESLEWELRNGRPRVVRYLAYPGSYGMVPRTNLPTELGGDGDPLDVLVLGPALERGSVVAVRPIGVLRMLDDGERDDKIIAVQIEGPLSDVTNLGSLDVAYPGVSKIVETWFSAYKGPGEMESRGWADATAANEIVREASRYYELAHRTDAR